MTSTTIKSFAVAAVCLLLASICFSDGPRVPENFFSSPAIVDLNKAAADPKALNSLSVSPITVVKNRDKILSTADIAPELEILCIRATLRNPESLKKDAKSKEDWAKVKQKIESLKERLELLEAGARTKISALKYTTGVRPLQALEDETFIIVYVDALKELAAMGQLTAADGKALVPLLLSGYSEDQTDDANEEDRELKAGEVEGLCRTQCGYRLLQALGELQEPDILVEIAAYLPEKAQKENESYPEFCLLSLFNDAYFMLGHKPADKAAWLELLSDLRGRLTWRGGCIEGQENGESGPGVNEDPFFCICWKALYMDRDVFLANGAFRQPLTDEEKTKLEAFEKLDEDSQRKAAIKVWRKRKLKAEE